MEILQISQELDLEQLNNILSKKGSSIILDWKNCTKISPITFCSILHLQNLEVKIEHKNKNQAFNLFNEIYNYKINPFLETKTHLFVSPVEAEKSLVEHTKLMQQFFEPYTEDKDISNLQNVFSELYMNICQHSKSNGYILIEQPNENKVSRLFFSDIGVGIAAKIKLYYINSPLKEDAEFIKYATEEGVTTKSQIQNQGRGLNNLVQVVKGLKAKVEIFSNYGHYQNKQGHESLYKLNFQHQGTLIILDLPLANLSEKEPLEYEDL